MSILKELRHFSKKVNAISLWKYPKNNIKQKISVNSLQLKRRGAKTINRNKEKNIMTQKLLKIADAAELLGVSQFWLYRLVEKNAIPVIRLGRVIRFDPADLSRWLDEQRQMVTRG